MEMSSLTRYRRHRHVAQRGQSPWQLVEVEECLEHHNATCTRAHDCDTFVGHISDRRYARRVKGLMELEKRMSEAEQVRHQPCLEAKLSRISPV